MKILGKSIESKKQIRKIISHNYFPLFLFIPVILIFMWPLITSIGSRIYAGGDSYFVAWVIDSGIQSIRNLDWRSLWDQNIFFPYPNSMAFSDHSITLALQALPVSFFTNNYIVYINYTILISILLAFLGGYFLVFHYSKNKIASFVSGLIFAFSPYHFGTMDHLQIFSYQYLPFLFLFAEKLIKFPNLKNSLLFACFFILNAFVSIYLLAYSLIPLIILFTVRIISKKRIFTKVFIKNLLLSFFLILICLFPFYYRYLSVSKLHNIEREDAEILMFSADFYDYLLAPRTHILFNKYRKRIQSIDPQNFWSEHTLYFGISIITLASLSIIKLTRMKKFTLKEIQARINITPLKIIYILSITSSIIISFGPERYFHGHRIILPYKFLYKFLIIFKAIRVPTRVHIITSLSLSVLVGLFVSNCLKIRDKVKRYILLCVVIILLFIEIYPMNLTVKDPQAVNSSLYEWIDDNLSEKSVFVHYPYYFEITYLRGDEISKREMFNGYSGFFPESTRRMMDTSMAKRFSTNPSENLTILSNLGVKYLIVHTSLIDVKDDLGVDFRIKLMQSLNNSQGIYHVKEVGGDHIYDIEELYDSKYFKTDTKISTQYDPIQKSIILKESNGTNHSWTSDGLQMYKVHIIYCKDTKIVYEQIKEIYRPLYLNKGEILETKIHLEAPFWIRYDNVEADTEIYKLNME